MRLENAKELIETLLLQGDSFTYSNFSTKGRYGYPQELEPGFIAWRSKVRSLINVVASKESASFAVLKSAESVHIIGNGEDRFLAAMRSYKAALRECLDILQTDPLGQLNLAEHRKTVGPNATSNRVFVVHGHDEQAKQEPEILLAEMGLQPIVLHRQADGGKTLIEKFEHFSDVGFAFVLLTADEFAYLVSEVGKP